MSSLSQKLNIHRSIPALLLARTEQDQEAIALTAPERKPLTYGRLFRHIKEVVSQLRGRGIQRHDRVAVILRNRPETAVAFLAIASSSAYVPLNPNYSPSELGQYLSRLKPKALITEAPISETYQTLAQQHNILLMALSAKETEAAGLFSLQAPT